MEPRISVIIPCYNCEKYISECISSLLEQTFTNFEIIAINDGSTDSTLSILRDYNLTDNRLIVIDQPNAGVSAARNRGIKEAKGMWITFIDSDDWVDNDYIQQLCTLIEDCSEVDLISSGIRYIFANGSEEEIRLPVLKYNLFNASSFLSAISQPLITSPVGKLYRKNVILKNNLYFPIGLQSGEDRAFNLDYLLYCRQTICCDYIGYNYRRDISQSLSSLVRCNEIKVNIQYWSDMHQAFIDRGFLTEEAKEYLAKRLYNIIADYVMCPRYNREYLKNEINNINWRFLKENQNYINAPRLLNILVRYHSFSIMRLIYHIRN